MTRFIVIALLLAGCASGGSLPLPAPNPPQTWTITNGTVSVKASAAFGAAVVSLTDGAGNQYVNAIDHGRLDQTAATFDNLGEGENPTEAGSAADGSGSITTTVIDSAAATGNVLKTSVSPAYWYAYNGQAVSPDTISKTVTVGYGGLANVVRWDVAITVAAPHTQGSFEGLTGYGPMLPNVYVQQADGSFLLTAQAQNIEVSSTTPIIEASADGLQAIGLYSPQAPAFVYVNDQNVDGSGVNKWDCAWWSQWTVSPGAYSITCYLAVGTLASVEASLLALEKM